MLISRNFFYINTRDSHFSTYFFFLEPQEFSTRKFREFSICREIFDFLEYSITDNFMTRKKKAKS